MDNVERIRLVKAMEFIARQVNDEMVFEDWLTNGVADGAVEYGDLTASASDEEALGCYIEDDAFAETMASFLRVMSCARKFGGMCCDKVSTRGELRGKAYGKLRG